MFTVPSTGLGTNTALNKLINCLINGLISTKAALALAPVNLPELSVLWGNLDSDLIKNSLAQSVVSQSSFTREHHHHHPGRDEEVGSGLSGQ